MVYGILISMKIEVPEGKIREFCRKNGIQKLFFFGSVLTDRFKPDSDVDVLVEFEQGKGPGFLGLSRMELELEDMLHRKVDLRTPQELSRYFRDEVLATAQVRYAGS